MEITQIGLETVEIWFEMSIHRQEVTKIDFEKQNTTKIIYCALKITFKKA